MKRYELELRIKPTSRDKYQGNITNIVFKMLQITFEAHPVWLHYVVAIVHYQQHLSFLLTFCGSIWLLKRPCKLLGNCRLQSSFFGMVCNFGCRWNFEILDDVVDFAKAVLFCQINEIDTFFEKIPVLKIFCNFLNQSWFTNSRSTKDIDLTSLLLTLNKFIFVSEAGDQRREMVKIWPCKEWRSVKNMMMLNKVGIRSDWRNIIELSIVDAFSFIQSFVVK